MNITEKYTEFLNDLQGNPNIEINQDEEFTRTELYNISEMFFQRKKKTFEELEGIILTDSDKSFFQITTTSILWESKLENVDYVLKGGYQLNGLTNALTFYSNFWKGAFSLAPDAEVPKELKHFEQLGWYEHRPYGNGDHNRGCFVKQAGAFPPQLAFYRSGWYTKLDLNLEEYLTTLFQNYAVSGWQFFYIDITEDIPELDIVLREMRMVSEQMPLLFPEKDWSYHKKRYEDTLKRLDK